MNELDFDLIRPYTFDEVQEAIPRMLKDPHFHSMTDFLFSKDEKARVIENIKKAKSIHEFQIALTLPCVEAIVKNTTESLSFKGIENLSREHSNVFLANHRDIVLDSSILGAILYRNGFETPQVTWGSNLMVTPLIVDFGKSNQMITVFREGSPKELLLNSQRLSAYIRKSVVTDQKPVWIAHRKGRAKTGFDKTDDSILKMLTLSGDSDIISKLCDLNLTPTTISYEWEPCDSMKVNEIYQSQDHTYVKANDEDFNSIIGGLTGEKGRVHITVGKSINDKIKSIDTNGLNHNEVISLVAEIVDKEIYKDYCLWPSNYLAYDILNNTTKYSDEYNSQIIEKFESRYKKTVELTGKDNSTIRELFLSLYANPVINMLKNKD